MNCNWCVSLDIGYILALYDCPVSELIITDIHMLISYTEIDIRDCWDCVLYTASESY